MADPYSSSSRVGLAFGISAVVGLLAGCRPSPHQAAFRDDASRTVSDAASPPGRSLDARETATHVDAAAATTSPRSQTSQTSPEVWLRDHGIQTWQHDSACWARAPLPGSEWINHCGCLESLTLTATPPVGLLVCERAYETRGTYVPWVSHSVLYAADKGHLRVVLDVPSHAGTDSDLDVPSAEETSAEYASRFVGDASVRIDADGADLAIVDVSRGHSCDAAVAVGKRLQLGDLPEKYQSVCASIGRWRWTGSGLVRIAR